MVEIMYYNSCSIEKKKSKTGSQNKVENNRETIIKM